MQSYLRQPLKISHPRGFTLLELMTVVAVIGILAAFAIPTYRGYVNEAKAAEILVDLKSIGLAYHDAMLVDPGIQTNALDYDSAEFGKSPSALSVLDPAYRGPDNIAYATYLVNHSGYFQFAHDGQFPIAFIKATNASERGVLHALNHLMHQQHAFVNEDLMVIALAEPMGRGNYAVNKPPKPDLAKPQPSSAASAGTATEPSTSGPANSGPPNDGAAQTPDTTSGGSSSPDSGISGTDSGSSSGDIGLNWPPGWAKHPGQHQGQNFPGSGHH